MSEPGPGARRGRRRGRDRSVITAGRGLKVRFSDDRTVIAQVRTARPIIVFVDCPPLAIDVVVAIAKVWWASRHAASDAGVGVPANGGAGPTYKFKVAAVGERTTIRFVASTPHGKATVPPRGTPGAPLHTSDPEQCAAVAAALVADVVEALGPGTGERAQEANLAALLRTHRRQAPPGTRSRGRLARWGSPRFATTRTTSALTKLQTNPVDSRHRGQMPVSTSGT